jgi:hypothetical protein
MDETQVRKIIRDELSDLIKSDKYTFYKLMQILDGRNIQLGRTTGTKIGTETTQKLGFFNNTPAVQQAHIADPSGGATIDAAARNTINSILAVLETFGFTASS